MADDSIIIKKIKKGGGGHHGGAWKVAYADFVTAMMAFFLLMWLLATTSPQQQQGLAEYFTPTYGLKDSKGIGVEGGKAPNAKGKSQSDLSDPGIVVGRVPQGPDATAPTPKIDDTPKDQNDGKEQAAPQSDQLEPEKDKQDVTGEQGSKEADEKDFKRIEQELMNSFENSPTLQELKDQVIVTHTPEGLKIDMVDDQNRPMFAPGSALMTDVGKTMLKAVNQIVQTSENQISVSGHTDATPFGAGTNYTNWELSSDRANASRRFLGQVGMEKERFLKVEGRADTDLLVPNEPTSPRNTRISITLIRGTQVEKRRDVRPTTKGLLSVPQVSAPAQEGAGQ